jgi:hypothetical protein
MRSTNLSVSSCDGSSLIFAETVISGLKIRVVSFWKKKEEKKQLTASQP